MSLCPYCEADYNEESCEHFVLVYDRTFPFASGMSRCPLSIESHEFDAGSLDEVDEAVGKAVAAILAGKRTLGSFRRLPKRLFALTSAVLDGCAIEDGEFVGDPYIGLRAFRDYVDTCIEGSRKEIRSGHFEQNIPCASSAYSEFWSKDGSAVIRYLEGKFRTDAGRLEKALAPKPPAPKRRAKSR